MLAIPLMASNFAPTSTAVPSWMAIKSLCVRIWLDESTWLVVEPPTPLKNDGLKVSWDDEIPNWMEQIIVMFQSPPTRDLFTGKLGHEKHVQPTTVFTVQPVLLLIYPIFHSPMFVGWNRLFAAETHCGKSHSEASWYSRRWKPRGSYKMDVFP